MTKRSLQRLWERLVGSRSQLPDHESGLRRMMADAQGTEYRAYESIDEAKGDPDAVAVFEGDDGGQIYAVVPVREIACSTPTLDQLLADLDHFSWDDPDMRRIYYERRPLGRGRQKTMFCLVKGRRGGTAFYDGEPRWMKWALDRHDMTLPDELNCDLVKSQVSPATKETPN